MNEKDFECWTLVQALVWIETRNESTAKQCASLSPRDTDTQRAVEAAINKTAAPLYISNIWKEHLAPALDTGQLRALADCIHVNKFAVNETALGVIFPPAQNPAMASSCFLEDDKASLTPDGARSAHEFDQWQNVRFSTRDIRRLWPESKSSEAERLSKSPWTCPPGLTPASIALLGNAPHTPLSAVISLLAFGHSTRPENMHETIAAAHRMRAATHLFLAARDGKVKLYGTHAGTGAHGPIPAEGFNIPHNVSADYDCEIEPDFGSVQMNEFVDLRRDPKRARWRDVTVERKSFTTWAREVAAEGRTPPGEYMPLLEAITLLAFEKPMDCAGLSAYYGTHGAAPAEDGTKPKDLLGLVAKYDKAQLRIFHSARDGRLTIFARQSKAGTNRPAQYSAMAEYKAVPPEFFIAKCFYGPMHPWPLHYEGDPIFSAPWFEPRVKVDEFEAWQAARVEINIEWPKPKVANAAPNLDDVLRHAAEKNGGKLAQAKAEKVAQEAGAIENRKEIRDRLKILNLNDKQGRKKLGKGAA